MTARNRLTLGRYLVTFVVLLSAPAAKLRATESIVFADEYQRRIANLEAEFASLQQDFHLASATSSNVDEWAVGQCTHEGASGFFAGAAIVFAKPHFKEAFQVSHTNAATGQLDLIPFSYEHSAAPRFWLGYTTPDDLGIRASYWQFDQAGDSATRTSDGIKIFGAHAVTIIFPATILADTAGETLIATDGLETHLVTLEGMMHTQVAGISVTGGAGLRYASLRQTVNSTVVNPLGVPTGILNWSRRYEGIGPTLSAEMKRPLGCRGLSGVAGGGGALLFGSKTIDRFVVGDVGVPPAPPFLTLDGADEVVGMGELRIGLEFAHQFQSGAELTIAGLYEGQLWAEAGAPTLGFLGFEGFALSATIKL